MLQVHNSSDIVLLQGSNNKVSADRIFIDYIGNLINLSASFWRILIKLVYLFNCILKMLEGKGTSSQHQLQPVKLCELHSG